MNTDAMIKHYKDMQMNNTTANEVMPLGRFNAIAKIGRAVLTESEFNAAVPPFDLGHITLNPKDRLLVGSKLIQMIHDRVNEVWENDALCDAITRHYPDITNSVRIASCITDEILNALWSGAELMGSEWVPTSEPVRYAILAPVLRAAGIHVQGGTDQSVTPVDKTDSDYRRLRETLDGAYAQATSGKGKERHACDLPFQEQPIMVLPRMLGNNAGLLYQVMKKCQESSRMPKDAAIRDLRGAINYAAAAIIFLEDQDNN